MSLLFFSELVSHVTSVTHPTAILWTSTFLTTLHTLNFKYPPLHPSPPIIPAYFDYSLYPNRTNNALILMPFSHHFHFPCVPTSFLPGLHSWYISLHSWCTYNPHSLAPSCFHTLQANPMLTNSSSIQHWISTCIAEHGWGKKTNNH